MEKTPWVNRIYGLITWTCMGMGDSFPKTQIALFGWLRQPSRWVHHAEAGLGMKTNEKRVVTKATSRIMTPSYQLNKRHSSPQAVRMTWSLLVNPSGSCSVTSTTANLPSLDATTPLAKASASIAMPFLGSASVSAW